MNGHDYIAAVPLYDREGHVLAVAGARCDQVTPSSLPLLLTRGWITAAPPTPAVGADQRRVQDEEDRDALQ